MIRLHGFPMSPNTRRAQLGLEEAGIEYELVPVDLMSGEQRSETYRALNPTARVPALVDGEFVLWESNAVLEYIAALAPAMNLGPANPRERGEISRWMYMNACHLSPAMAHIFAHSIRLPEDQRIPKLVENGRAEVGRCLEPFNQRLATGSEFILDRLTIADISIAPTLGIASMLGVDLSQYPNVAEWHSRVRARASWKKIYGS
jgi:glutathione S-transferase